MQVEEDVPPEGRKGGEKQVANNCVYVPNPPREEKKMHPSKTITLKGLMEEAPRSPKNRKERRAIDAVSLDEFLCSRTLMETPPFEFLKVEDVVMYNTSLMAKREEEKRSEKFRKWTRWEAKKCKELLGRPEEEWFGKR